MVTGSMKTGLKAFCGECGQPYVKQTSWQRFDCYDCQQAWHKRKYHAIKQWWEEQGGEEAFELREAQQR